MSRNIDEVAAKYLSDRPGPRSLGLTRADKLVIIDLYRKFRQTLQELRVVSLDQFIADFLDYLQSFRWAPSGSSSSDAPRLVANTSSRLL